jgi:tRNA(adenine34) deaminase
MCAGASINARLTRVVYGAREPVSGACGSVLNLFVVYGAPTAVTGGVLAEECAAILTAFFEARR